MYYWPATPTPLPSGIPHFDLDGVYTLWKAAPVAIQMWNWMGIASAILQLVIVVVVVAGGGMVIYRAFNRFTERDAQS